MISAIVRRSLPVGKEKLRKTMRAQAFFTGVGISLLLSAPHLIASVSGAEPSNLSEIVETALKNNPEIHAAQRRVEAARARAGHATYLEDPEVNIEAWGVPLNQPLRYRSANPLVFGVRQKLPFFGKLGLKGEMAAEEVRIAEEEFRAKEQEVVAKVKAAYADYFMAGKNVEIHPKSLELIRQMSECGRIVQSRQGAAAGYHQGDAGTDGAFQQTDLG